MLNPYGRIMRSSHRALTMTQQIRHTPGEDNMQFSSFSVRLSRWSERGDPEPQSPSLTSEDGGMTDPPVAVRVSATRLFRPLLAVAGSLGWAPTLARCFSSWSLTLWLRFSGFCSAVSPLVCPVLLLSVAWSWLAALTMSCSVVFILSVFWPLSCLVTPCPDFLCPVLFWPVLFCAVCPCVWLRMKADVSAVRGSLRN